MNDLDLLRTMRADAPEPAGDRLAAGRDHLRSAAAPGRDHRSRHVMILASGLAAASVIVATQQSRPAPPVGPAVARLLSSTQVLDRAAAAAASRPALLPGPHQWVYQRGVKSPANGSARFTVAGWTRFDGRKSAVLENGKLVIYPGTPQDAKLLATPRAAARYLASLPANPAAVLAAIYHTADSQPRDQRVSPNRNARAYSILMTLLWNAPVGVPPAHQAAAFRAMAKIPGVTVRRGLVDAAGRPAIGLGFSAGKGLTGYFLLNPRTYAVSGLSSGAASVARISVEVVNKPGQT